MPGEFDVCLCVCVCVCVRAQLLQLHIRCVSAYLCKQRFFEELGWVETSKNSFASKREFSEDQTLGAAEQCQSSLNREVAL